MRCADFRDERSPATVNLDELVVRVVSVEDAHAAGTDQQADHDQNDPPYQLPAKDRHNPRDDKDHSDDPQDEVHDNGSKERGFGSHLLPIAIRIQSSGEALNFAPRA
jgi:hypothetical protein